MLFSRCRCTQLATVIQCTVIIVGCQYPNSTMPVLQGQKPESQPAPEEARTALVELLESPNFEKKVKRSPDGALFLRGLNLKESREKVRKEPVRLKNGLCIIDGWVCDLANRRFNSPGIFIGGAILTLEGNFELDDNNKWKAVVLGISHGNLGPGK